MIAELLVAVQWLALFAACLQLPGLDRDVDELAGDVAIVTGAQS